MYHPRGGFTLFEVLCVVTIMAILVALLLPMLRLVREEADRVRCAANLRQNAMASLAFSTDNRGYLCPNDGYGWWDANQYWNRTLAAYSEDDASQQQRGSHRSNTVQWGCPTWTKQKSSLDKALVADYWYFLYQENMTGYAMIAAWPQPNSNQWLENGWWFVDNNRYTNFDASSTERWARRDTEPWQLMVKAAQVTPAANALFFGDGYFHFAHGWYQAYGTAEGRKLILERHRGTGNWVYVDGHVGRLSGEAWASTFWNPAGG
jgi:prepilin-type N-terminal cleavage/methylation domain-containing protein/prepilin-type processing-associated H-X9-DG protein